MMTTYFLASVVGWYMVLMSFMLFFRRNMVVSAVTHIMDQPGLFFLVAFMTVIIGLLMVVSHNLWVMGWPVVITLIAWLTLFSGLLRLFYPECVHKTWHKLSAKTETFTIIGVVVLVIGLFLLYKVYFVW